MSKHILLVDDDALLRRSLAFNLQQAGFSTITAANAEDALVMARQDPPDLVILDIGLPGMDGLDALRHFRESMNAPSPLHSQPCAAFAHRHAVDGHCPHLHIRDSGFAA